jgi:hypothetical protein
LWRATDEQAWQMTAVAARLCEHSGTYAIKRAPQRIFLMFKQVYLDRFEIG